MSATTYFADAADYWDWWFYSGTALGASSPGETFRMLYDELSEAGANAVIAARFLEENDGGIDPRLWRRAFVFRHVGLQVSLTLRALEAIGAAGIIRALRTSPGQPSLISRAQEIAQSGQSDSEAIAKLAEELRENIAVAASHVLGDPHLPAPRPRQVEGVESREEVRRLLDAYVAAHQDELMRDVARHGDPRKYPDFDRGRADEDRARRIERLNNLSYQRGAIDGLRERLDRLKSLAEKETPESPRLNKVLRKVLDEYEGFAEKPPEDLTPEVAAWLGEVERFREAQFRCFRPEGQPGRARERPAGRDRAA